MGYIKQEHKVDELGIHVPVVEYCDETTTSLYETVLTKEDFIRAYVKFILIPNIKNTNKFEGTKFLGENITDDYLENKLVSAYMSGNFESYNLFKLV